MCSIVFSDFIVNRFWIEFDKSKIFSENQKDIKCERLSYSGFYSFLLPSLNEDRKQQFFLFLEPFSLSIEWLGFDKHFLFFFFLSQRLRLDYKSRRGS